MNAAVIIGGVLWAMLAGFFSVFIVWFDRKKYFSPQSSLYYIVLFFITGLLLLAVSLRY